MGALSEKSSKAGAEKFKREEGAFWEKNWAMAEKQFEGERRKMRERSAERKGVANELVARLEWEKEELRQRVAELEEEKKEKEEQEKLRQRVAELEEEKKKKKEKKEQTR